MQEKYNATPEHDSEQTEQKIDTHEKTAMHTLSEIEIYHGSDAVKFRNQVISYLKHVWDAGGGEQYNHEEIVAHISDMMDNLTKHTKIYMDIEAEDIITQALEHIFINEGTFQPTLRKWYDEMVVEQVAQQVLTENIDAIADGYIDQSGDRQALSDILHAMRHGDTHSGTYSKDYYPSDQWNAFSQKAEELLTTHRERQLSTFFEEDHR